MYQNAKTSAGQWVLLFNYDRVTLLGSFQWASPKSGASALVSGFSLGHLSPSKALSQKSLLPTHCDLIFKKALADYKNGSALVVHPFLKEVTRYTVAPADNSLSKASALKVNTALRKYAALHLKGGATIPLATYPSCLESYTLERHKNSAHKGAFLVFFLKTTATKKVARTNYLRILA